MGYLLWKVSLKDVTNTLKRLWSSFLRHQFFFNAFHPWLLESGIVQGAV